MHEQRFITAMLPKLTGDVQLDKLIKDRAAKQSHVSRCRMNFNAAHNKSEMDITFQSVLKDKENHNVHGRHNVMKGIGSTKIERLIRAEIYSAHALLAADPTDYMASGLHELIPKWQCMVESYYKKLRTEMDVLRAELEVAESDLQDASDELLAYRESDAARAAQRHEQLRRSNPYHSSNRGRRHTPP